MSPVMLVRHASAGQRAAWEGDDRARPLDRRGARQAEGLVALLRDLPVERIISSPARRCVATVEPLARDRSLPVIEEEGLWEDNAEASIEVVLSLAGAHAVVCSHGDNIPAVLAHLARLGVDLGPHPDCKKGSTWVLEPGGQGFRSARYLPPPA